MELEGVWHEVAMDSPVKISNVIEIHPNAKYVLVVPRDTSAQERERLHKWLREWWGNPSEPFAIVSDVVTLQRVDA